MREIDVRSEQDESKDCSVKVTFGMEGENLTHNQGEDTFTIVDGHENLYLYVEDIPMLKKALKKLEEFVVPVGDPDEEF